MLDPRPLRAELPQAFAGSVNAISDGGKARDLQPMPDFKLSSLVADQPVKAADPKRAITSNGQ